jgi:hypothetical protein
LDSQQSESKLIEDIEILGPGLAKIRRRRWLVWTLIIVYLPTMWISQRLAHSFEGALPVFCIWFLLLLMSMAYSATIKCPRCGKNYHVNGMILLYLRRCLHCQLPLNADKKRKTG